MRVIEALRYIGAEWIIFCDLDQKDHAKVFSKRMKKNNIPWEKLKRIEWKWVSSVNFDSRDGTLIIRYSARRSIYERGIEK